MNYEVLKPLTTNDGEHKPGQVIEADHFHNVRALVEQRYLRPIGDSDKIASLQAQVDQLRERAAQIDQLRERVTALEMRAKQHGGGK